MNSVRVVGRFLTEANEPLDGLITFVPNDLWFEKDGVPYMYMAADQDLNEGCFDAQLTPGASYTVLCPVGKFTIRVPASTEQHVFLKDMIPSRFQ